ncbi:MAG: S-layer homology domain-containing protein [Chloroflexia bacterium]
MKRLLLVVVMLALAAGVGALEAGAAAPSTSMGHTGRVTAKAGNFGKITAIKPPGDWHPLGAPADMRRIFKQLAGDVLPVFGVDTNIGGGNETVIAANPANPLNFLAGANNTARFTTTDGGLTWNVGSLPGGGDPAATFDSGGRAYFAELGNTSSCPDNPLIWKSTDGGRTFGSAVQPLTDPVPLQHFFDKEWVTADNNPTSPFQGRIYYTASNFNIGTGCNLSQYINVSEQLVFSTDQGATWSSPVNINDAAHDQDQFTNPVAARDGTLYVGYQYQNCTFNCASNIPMSNMLGKSTNGGVSFSPSITITGQPISSTGSFISGYQYLYAGSTASGFRHNDQAIIGVSPTNANQVYALWTDGRWDTSFVYQGVTGLHADIAFSRSTDGGSTWTAPVRVNDDPQANGKDQFFPWMAVGPDGTLHATWSDRRDSPTGFQYREYYSQSTDGGLTWAANIPVADAAGTPSTFIGDYSGLAVNSDNTLVLPIWTDMRSGQRAYTDRGVQVPISTSTPTSTPTNTVPPTLTVTATAPAATGTSTPGTSPTATLTATPCTIPFTDVHSTDYFYEGVRWLYCGGAISGYGDNTFRPYNNTTRGQMTKIVVLAYGIPTYNPTSPTFNDVPASNAFYTYVETAAHSNIVSGYNCGGPGEPCPGVYFRSGNLVTRGQLSKIIVVAAGWGLINPTAATFNDVERNSTFYTYIETAYCHQIISGYDCGGPGEPCPAKYFRPGNNATRGQIAKIVFNAVSNLPCAGDGR